MIIEIPPEHYVSPANGTLCTLDTLRQIVTDAEGFEFGVDEMLDADVKGYLLGLCHIPNDERLLWGAVHNAKSRDCVDVPYWSAVSDTLAVGSTSARAICIRYGIDPDTVKKCFCENQEITDDE